MLRCTLIFSLVILSAVALLAQGDTVPCSAVANGGTTSLNLATYADALGSVSINNCQWEGALVQLTLSGRLSVRISNLVITGGSVRGCCRVSSWQRWLAAGSR